MGRARSTKKTPSLMLARCLEKFWAGLLEAQWADKVPVGRARIQMLRVFKRTNCLHIQLQPSSFFKPPDNFILDDQGEVLRGRWISDNSANVVFAKQ